MTWINLTDQPGFRSGVRRDGGWEPHVLVIAGRLDAFWMTRCKQRTIDAWGGKEGVVGADSVGWLRPLRREHEHQGMLGGRRSLESSSLCGAREAAYAPVADIGRRLSGGLPGKHFGFATMAVRREHGEDGVLPDGDLKRFDVNRVPHRKERLLDQRHRVHANRHGCPNHHISKDVA